MSLDRTPQRRAWVSSGVVRAQRLDLDLSPCEMNHEGSGDVVIIPILQLEKDFGLRMGKRKTYSIVTRIVISRIEQACPLAPNLGPVGVLNASVRGLLTNSMEPRSAASTSDAASLDSACRGEDMRRGMRVTTVLNYERPRSILSLSSEQLV